MSPYEKMTGKRFDLNIFKGKVPLSDCWVNTANPGDKPVNKLGSNNIKAVYLLSSVCLVSFVVCLGTSFVECRGRAVPGTARCVEPWSKTDL